MRLPSEWNIGKRLKYIREFRGFTQKALAKKTKLSYRTIEMIEQHRRTNPEMKTLLALSAALQVPITAFVPWYTDIPYGLETK